MGHTAAVVGASGYAGGELLRLLVGHPDLSVGPLAGATSAGMSLGDVHPHLAELADRRLLAVSDQEAFEADVVFVALPHGKSAEKVSQRTDSVKVVDLGADFRLRDGQAWSDYYGGVHAGVWTYGLPELPGQRQKIASTNRIANPGCYPTAVALAASPLMKCRWLDPANVVVVAVSGTSGAGKKATAALLGAEVMGSMSAYKIGGSHQHTPEMEQTLSGVAEKSVTVSFTPMLAPMPRGILATVSIATTEAVDEGRIRDEFADFYLNEPFVRILPAGQLPRTADVLGSNTAHLQVAVDQHACRIVVVAAIDNLVKGAGGQALQNANLMLGLPEEAGLPVNGVAP